MKKKIYITCYKDEKNKRWVSRVRWFENVNAENMKTKYFTASTKKEVKALAAEFSESLQEHMLIDVNVLNLKTWIEKWLNSIKSTVKSRTLEYYTYLSYGYVVPNIGNIALADIRPIDIQTMLNNVKRLDGQKKELSRSTKNGIRATLRAAFTAAFNNGYISYNPVKATKPVKGFIKERKAFSKEQMEILLDIAEKQWLERSLFL